MTDLPNSTNGIGETEDDPQMAANLPVVIHTQYIKDLSFENPLAPDSLRTQKEPPKMDIDINIDAVKIESEMIEHFFEVQMALKVTANRDDQIVFITELLYAAAVSLNDVPEKRHHPLLLVQTPQYIFPFARHIISDTIQRGGFPPLMLNPVNFREMYIRRFGRAGTEEA